MAKKTNKRTLIYVDGKRVKVKDCKHIKGINGEIKHLRNLCFLPEMSVSKNYSLTNNKKMKIVVTNKK